MSNQAAYGDAGPSRSTSHSGRFSRSGDGTAMWFGTMSSTTPSPCSRAVAASARSPRSPPSSARTRVWSVTSYPWVEPGTASSTGDRCRWDTPSEARYATSASAAANGNSGHSWRR